MKKSIPYLILCLLIILTACNPTAGTGTPNKTLTIEAATRQTPSRPTRSPAPTITPTSDPLLQIPLEELNGLQIRFWHPWSGELAQAMGAIVNDFNNTNAWGIQVITTSFGGSAGLIDSLRENRPVDKRPHVLISSSEQILMLEDQYQFFTDLNLYISDGQWGLSGQEQADIPQIYWQQDSNSDRQLGIPALRDMHVLFYNTSWAEDLGFSDVPLTFNSFSIQTCAASAERKDIDETGGWIINTNPLTTYSWLAAAGVTDLYDPQNNSYRFNTPGAVQVFSKLKDMTTKGCFWNPRLPDPYDYFANRQALVYSGTLTDMIPQAAAMQKMQNADEWQVLPYPADGENQAVIVNGSSYAILETSPAEQLASWLFLRWLALPRNQAALSSASGYLPVSGAALDEMKSFTGQYPQWLAAVQWVPTARSAPHSGSWILVQNMLEDAAWQTYQTYTAREGIHSLLKELDAMIPEILTENGLE